MSHGTFYVQCVSGKPGHTMEVIPGGTLEERCVAHVEAGHIDALCLDRDECPECVEDRRQRARDERHHLDLYGCPMAERGECGDDCLCRNPDDRIVDSSYDDQVQPLALV